MKLSEQWLRAKQLSGLVGVFGYHNVYRHLGHRLDPDGVICHRVSQLASRRALDFLQVKVETRGLTHLRNLQNFCVISNHASYLDWALLLAYFPTPLRFIAKRELTRMPIIGAFLRHRGVLIDRSRGLDAKTAIRAAVNDGQPYPIMIFPEGTRTYDGSMQPFKAGGLRIMAEAGRAFLPVSLRGTYEALPRDGRCVLAGSKLQLVVGPPLYPANYEDSNDLIAVCESRIQRMTRGEDPTIFESASTETRTPTEQPRPARAEQAVDWSPRPRRYVRHDQLSG